MSEHEAEAWEAAQRLPDWRQGVAGVLVALQQLHDMHDERLTELEQRPVCRCQGHALVRPSWWKRLLSWLGLHP